MRFEKYERPSTVKECIDILDFYKKDAKILAGGTNIIPRLRQRAAVVKALVDIGTIPGLSEVRENEDSISIGAMMRLHNVEHNEEIRKFSPLVSMCAGHVSSMQVRNVGTIGGNSCDASPSADTVPGLLVLDATAKVSGKDGDRKIKMRDFFVGPGKTVLGPTDFLNSFEVPKVEPGTGVSYYKYAIRGDTDIAIIGSAALIATDEDGIIKKASIALASVGPTALLISGAERELIGARGTESLFSQIADLCSETCTPITDQRATSEYRREMVRVWTEKALNDAFDRSMKTHP